MIILPMDQTSNPTMSTPTQDYDNASENKKVVLSFLEALNASDFQVARKFTHEHLNFVGVLGSRHGADAYFQDMERMQLKYEVLNVFADQNEVCIWYNITISGISVPSAGLYYLQNGKILDFRVLFDPRPLLENKQ